MNLRRVVLGVALAATLAASWWAVTDEGGADTLVAPVERKARPGGAPQRDRSAATMVSGRLERLADSRPAWPDVSEQLARTVSFEPPPPPSESVRQEPVAPPLPFRFVGTIDDADGKAVFLLEGSQVRMARLGQQVGNQYRVERITPSGIEFTYLPLNVKQMLNRQNP